MSATSLRCIGDLEPWLIRVPQVSVESDLAAREIEVVPVLSSHSPLVVRRLPGEPALRLLETRNRGDGRPWEEGRPLIFANAAPCGMVLDGGVEAM